MEKVALAIAAHPDDIEFLMAGTLVLLRQQGYEIHYMNVSTGNCGSTEYDSETTAAIRLKEAQNSAGILEAQFHPPICNDFEIFYNSELLLRIAAVIRDIKPGVILTHSPLDYMEDHMNTSRLTTTAAFVRGVPNYDTGNPAAGNYNCAIYHAVPHGLRGPLREQINPEIFVDTSSVHQVKMEALRAHESQQNWLEDSQKMNSYLLTMDSFSKELGRMSGVCEHAEGWRRHLHFGFSEENYNPLELLGKHYLPNEHYQY
jgi:LmbE family N-acetylglucosaminyl deacetylase